MKRIIPIVLCLLASIPSVDAAESSPNILSKDADITVHNLKDLQRLQGQNVTVVGIYLPYNQALPSLAERREREFAAANASGHLSLSRTAEGIPQEWAGILLEDGGFISIFPANHHDAKRPRYEREDFTGTRVEASGGLHAADENTKGVLADGYLYLNRLEPALADTASLRQQSLYRLLVKTARLNRWQYLSTLAPGEIQSLEKKFKEAPPTQPGKEDTQRPAAISTPWKEGRKYELLFFAAGAPPASAAALDLTLIRSPFPVQTKEQGRVLAPQSHLSAARLSISPLETSANGTPPALYEAVKLLSGGCFDAGPAVLASLEARIQSVPKGSTRRLFTPSLEAVVSVSAEGATEVILSRLGAPGADGWRSYCDLEPRTVSFRPRALWKAP